MTNIVRLARKSGARPPQRAVGVRRSCAFASGLQSAGVVCGSAANPVDLAVEIPLRYYSNKADPVTGAQGHALRFNDPSANSETILLSHLGSTWLNSATALTLSLACRYVGTNNYGALLGQWSSLQGGSDTNAQRVLMRYAAPTNQLEAFIYTGTNQNVAGSVSIEDDEYHWLAIRWDGATLTGWCDGKQISTKAASGTIISSAHSKVPELMGGFLSTNTTSGCPHFDLKAWAFHNRALSDGEMEAWYSPNFRWDWVDQGRRIITLPAAAAALDLRFIRSRRRVYRL